MRARIALGGVGVLVGLYGAWLVLSRGHDLLDLVLWLAGGVVLHDGVLGIALVVTAGVVLPVLPRALRAPVVVGAVVLGTVTLVAVPALGRFGARDDNPTLLPRDYWTGWLVLAAIVVVGVLVGWLVRRRVVAQR